MSILSGPMAGKRKHLFDPLLKGVHVPADMQHIGKLLLIAAFIMITACAGSLMGSKQASGVYHRVKKGETLYKIAQVYQVTLQQLAEVNNIDDIEILETGRILFIPAAQAVADDVLVAVKTQEATKHIVKTPVIPLKKPSPKSDGVAIAPGSEAPDVQRSLNQQSPKEKAQSQLSSAAKPEIAPRPDKTIFPLKLPSVLPKENNGGENLRSDTEQAKIQREKILFLWPVVGKVVAQFGIQPNGMFFNGIKIAAPEGAPVIAIADGVVIFSAPLKNYGETVILKHDNDYASVYTQLGQRLVKLEDRLKKGDKIATLAKSEMKGETLLNFEIRYKNIARNPLFLLP